MDQKREEAKHRTEWCVEAKQVSMHEVWKRQQVHEDARKMYRVEVLVRKLWENGESDIREHGKFTLEVAICSEEWIGSSDLVQKMLGLCEAENGTKVDEVLQARASRQKSVARCRNGFRFSKTAGFLPKRPKIGRLKEKEENYLEGLWKTVK